MKKVNIFASIDIEGILAHKKYDTGLTVKEQIVKEYGFDPTVGPITKPSDIQKLKDYATHPLRFGWTDYKQIPDYVRLISSKESSEGYKISDQDIEKGRVTSIYELQISADVGDTVKWWGHSINPVTTTQCIISHISHIQKKSGSGGITVPNISSSDISFYYASRGAGTIPSQGIRVETSSAYTTQLVIPNDWNNKVVSYDIEILLLSAQVLTSDSGLVSFPIAKLVVDPTINLQ